MLADGMLFWTRSVQNGLLVCPQSPRSTIRDGTTRWRMDDDQGISEYQTALKLDPRNAGTHVLLGMAQKKGGHAELAEKAYRQALEIEPNNIVALNNLAWIPMMTPERAGEAVGYAKKAAEAAPKMGQVLDTLGGPTT